MNGWVIACIAAALAAAAFFLLRGRKAVKSAGAGPAIPYDPAKQVPVIRSSICTGEKAAGFRSLEDGHFTEVLLIRSPEDEERFKKMYGLSEVKTEY